MSTILTLGESLLRLSTPNNQRLRYLNQLDVTFGGAEANVAINLSQLENTVYYATCLPDNEIADNIPVQMRAFGVNPTHILKTDKGRLGSYFVETGSDLRASNVVYDREISSIALLDDDLWDLEKLFEGITHFHTTGITLGLSSFWHTYLLKLIEYAKSKGIVISFDMNYRQKIWNYEEAKDAFTAVLPYVDILSAGSLDAKYFMDIDIDAQSALGSYLEQISLKYPNLSIIYGMNRQSITPNQYDIVGYIYQPEEDKLTHSRTYRIQHANDRIGTGDAFTAAVLDGILKQREADSLINFAIGASVLKHTVFGDINQFTSEEIENFVQNQGSNILR
ncbi:sugar kinase [Streptococcus merionis]|uniref:Ribokinase family sugar kinase n=1 Tax=Streptococcus merionis TaxID=400065 RepID=A0A239SUQ3_9STRE|nr:sugar kinase [Streptococcus merionis]SNU89245.1 ribokinase family sugar kinase [Streptococcus merionis]